MRSVHCAIDHHLGQKTKYYPVHPLVRVHAPVNVDDQDLDNALDSMLGDTQAGVAAVLNERCRHPLMKTTNWDRILESDFSAVNSEQLLELAADPDDKIEFDIAVRDGCREYLDLIHVYLNNCPLATRRKILGGTTQDHVETRGFHGYQEKSTRHRCADRLARLILMLVRIRNDTEKYGCLLVNDDGLFDTVDKIRNHDIDEEPVFLIEPIQDLLRQVFCRTSDWRDSYLNFNLYRFIIFQSLVRNDDAGHSFRSPLKISSALSEIQFWARGMVLLQLFISKWAPGSPVTTSDEFNYLCNFVSDGPNTPFNSVRELLRLLSVVVGSQPEMPNFYWQDDKCTTLVSASNCYALSIDHLSLMCSQLASDANQHMMTKLLYGFNLKEFDRILSNKLFDNLYCEDAGYSFLSDPKNNFKSVSDQFIRFMVGYNKDYFVESVSNNSIVWNADSCYNYLKCCDEFHELFLVLLHLTVGQPLRGEEASSLLLCRTGNSISRSIYWINDQLCILQRYHKGTSKSGKGKYVARFVAPEHTRFCLLYLAVIRPFQR